MDFNSFKNKIQIMTTQAVGNVSLHILTEEGSIKINESIPISAASVIKVPIVMACFNAYDKGLLDIYQTVTVKNNVAGTGVINYLSDLKELRIINLMELAIIVSDNTASNMLIDILGQDQINHFFKQACANNTKLARKFMDHNSLKQGIDNITTAFDMVTFMKQLNNNELLLSSTSKKMLLDILGNQQFRDKLASYSNIFAEKVYIGNKTGTLNGVEHDVALFINKDRKVYASVLTSEWEYNHDGQQFIAEIGKLILEYISTT